MIEQDDSENKDSEEQDNLRQRITMVSHNHSNIIFDKSTTESTVIQIQNPAC